jgi:hypothetical protein
LNSFAPRKFRDGAVSDPSTPASQHTATSLTFGDDRCILPPKSLLNFAAEVILRPESSARDLANVVREGISMKLHGLCAGLCCVSVGTVIWTGLLTHATSSAEEPELSLAGIATEFASFSCCESNIDFKKEKDQQIAHLRAATDVVKQQRTLEVFVNIALTWDCNPKADEPRQCVGKLTAAIKSNPLNTNGAGPSSSSLTITRMTEQHECPKAGKAKSVNGIFGLRYDATYPDSSVINGTLEINLTLNPQSKGKVKHTLSIPLKSKAGGAVETGRPTLKEIQ